jgi:HlyD family secretion protein
MTEPFGKDSNSKPGPDEARELMKLLKQSKDSSINPNDLPEEMKRRLTEHLKLSLKAGKETEVTSSQVKLHVHDGESHPDTALVEVHSVEVQEILGYIPNWIIRWGITIIVSTILVILIGSWFIRYPDIITASIDITTHNPPVYLRAQSGGKLQHLLVNDQQKVIIEQYLAILENTSNYEHVLQVKGHLEIIRKRFTNPSTDILSDLTFNHDNLLGEQQAEYKSFLNSCREYLQFYNYGYFKTKLNSLRDQLRNTRQKNELLTHQLQILQREFDLIQQQYDRTKTLFGSNLISSAEWENAHSKLLQKQYGLEGMKITVTSAALQVAQLEQNILELEHDSLQTEKRLRSDLMQTCDRLFSQILYWEQKYVIKAPIDGIVSLGHYWSEGQNIKTGDNIFSVLPEKISDLLGRIELPLHGSGKVKIGQMVNVKIINYPYTEYGMVRGIIQSKSMITEDDIYILKVSFPDNLTTNYGNSLPFSQKMKGEADIITDDLRLLERIFNQARSHISRQ